MIKTFLVVLVLGFVGINIANTSIEQLISKKHQLLKTLTVKKYQLSQLVSVLSIDYQKYQQLEKATNRNSSLILFYKYFFLQIFSLSEP